MVESIHDKGFFEPNKPSIIDLYADEEISLPKIIANIERSNLFSNIKVSEIRDGILKVGVVYKEVVFSIYLKIMDNSNNDLTKINKVLIDKEQILKANTAKKYIKSYIDAKHDYVKAYYAQIKLLSMIFDHPLLIVDCTQWCIYPNNYLNQFSKSQVDIVDSNLFKVKSSGDGCLYTEGLERFGIKDIEMAGVKSDYLKVCVSLLSRLSRFFIENGQNPNSCMTYTEVFENQFYACLIDIEHVLVPLEHHGLIDVKKRNASLNENHLYISVHSSHHQVDWHENDADVLEYLLSNATYYISQGHFENEMKLAQETIYDTVEFLLSIENHNDLMILANKDEITEDWCHFAGYDNGLIVLETPDKVIHKVKPSDIINWNYRGITPLNAYSLEI